MDDDLVVQVVAQPRSLRKCYLRICGADLEHEVRAKLVAPLPYSTPHTLSCKGKAGLPGKGVAPSLTGGQKPYKRLVNRNDTPTPDDAVRNIAGRCMQQVWIVRRRSRPGAQPHLVVLLHAADGRVAVAQLSGDTGCIPPLYGVGGSSGPSRKTCAIWGAKAWRWGQHGTSGAVGQYRRSFDVPKCHEVMAVALHDSSRIMVLHRPRARGSPQLWTINQPEDIRTGGPATASFFRVHGKGKGAGGKNKGGKGNSNGPLVGGSWGDDRWGTMNARQAVLPDDIVEGATTDGGSDVAGCPLFVPLWLFGEASTAPEVEVLRLEGKVDVCEPQAPGRRRRGCGGLCDATPQASWRITGRLHYRCREPFVPH